MKNRMISNLLAGIFLLILSGLTLNAGMPCCEQGEGESENMSGIYSFTMDDIDGNSVSLEKYKGEVLLVVNVASRCGYTKQYKGLVELYEEYKDQGFRVLGFPANNFMGQEPGTNAEIKEFCSMTFGVDFPMFAKISVKGDDIHPLYKYLTSEETNPGFAGPIGWNFNKFLIDRNGMVVARFGSGDKPMSDKVTKAVEANLAVQQ